MIARSPGTFNIESLARGAVPGFDGEHEDGVGEALDVVHGPAHARVLDREDVAHLGAWADARGQQASKCFPTLQYRQTVVEEDVIGKRSAELAPRERDGRLFLNR